MHTLNRIRSTCQKAGNQQHTCTFSQDRQIFQQEN